MKALLQKFKTTIDWKYVAITFLSTLVAFIVMCVCYNETIESIAYGFLGLVLLFVVLIVSVVFEKPKPKKLDLSYNFFCDCSDCRHNKKQNVYLSVQDLDTSNRLGINVWDWRTAEERKNKDCMVFLNAQQLAQLIATLQHVQSQLPPTKPK